MTQAYIEHRPKSTDKDETTTSHVVIVDGKEVHEEKTQKGAADWALAKGYTVHVARERHLQDHDIPDHWRQYNG